MGSGKANHAWTCAPRGPTSMQDGDKQFFFLDACKSMALQFQWLLPSKGGTFVQLWEQIHFW